MNSPLVSIITPNFNGARFLHRCVKSASMQDIAIEQIVVDDCSSDESWELLLQLAKRYAWLKPIRLDKNSGPIVARNEGIAMAQGRYLAFLDVDDFWMPEKLRTQISFMRTGDVAISYTDYRFVSEDAKKIGRRLRGCDEIGWHLHHMTRYLGCLTIVVDREKIREFKFPDISPAYRAEDFLALSYCISSVGRVSRCPFDLARYSVVANSRSSNAKRAARSVWKLYRDVERLGFLVASVYFFSYAIFVLWKRYWCRPIFDREEIDKSYEWSILN